MSVVILSGCATRYQASRCIGSGDGQVCSSIDIRSYRRFAEIDIKYDDENKVFTAQAKGVQTDTTALVEAINVINQTLKPIPN